MNAIEARVQRSEMTLSSAVNEIKGLIAPIADYVNEHKAIDMYRDVWRSRVLPFLCVILGVVLTVIARIIFP